MDTRMSSSFKSQKSVAPKRNGWARGQNELTGILCLKSPLFTPHLRRQNNSSTLTVAAILAGSFGVVIFHLHLLFIRKKVEKSFKIWSSHQKALYLW